MGDIFKLLYNLLVSYIRDDFDKDRHVHEIAKTKRVVLFNRNEHIEIFHAQSRMVFTLVVVLTSHHTSYNTYITHQRKKNCIWKVILFHFFFQFLDIYDSQCASLLLSLLMMCVQRELYICTITLSAYKSTLRNFHTHLPSMLVHIVSERWV